MRTSYKPLFYKLELFNFIHSLVSVRGKSPIKHNNYKDLRDYWIQPCIFANDKVEVQRNNMILPWSCPQEGKELMLELWSKCLFPEDSPGWPQWQCLEVSTDMNHTTHYTHALWCIISHTKVLWNKIKFKQDWSFVLWHIREIRISDKGRALKIK